MNVCIIIILAETRTQSGDRYGSGKLHSRLVLRGSLPLLSPGMCVYTYIYVYVCETEIQKNRVIQDVITLKKQTIRVKCHKFE
jgi:hypothetical protein